MRKLINLLLFIFITILCLLSDKAIIYAYSDELSENMFDYSEMQDFIDNEGIGNNINFTEIVESFLKNDTDECSQKIGQIIKESLFAEIAVNIKTIKLIITVVIIMAVFSDFACIVKSSQTSEMGFMVSYIMIITALTVSYGVISHITYEVVGVLVDFMKALLPAYLVSISMVNGQVYATGYCEMVLVVLTILEIICLKIILPAINLYAAIGMINNIAKEDFLSKSCEFIGSIVNILIKGMFMVIVGMNIFQRLFAPMSMGINNVAAKKIMGTISSITPYGNSISDLILGTGSVLKSSIGAAGLVVLCVIIMVPLIKIVIFKFSYQITNALIQPVSDKRINNCISCISTASDMLIKVVFGNFVMFMITIALVCIT